MALIRVRRHSLQMKMTVAAVAVCAAATALGAQSTPPTHVVDSSLLAAASRVVGAVAATARAWPGFRPPEAFALCQQDELTVVVARDASSVATAGATRVAVPGHNEWDAWVFEGRLPNLPPRCFTLRFDFDARRTLAFPAIDSIYSIVEPVLATTVAVLHESFHIFQRSAFGDTRLPDGTTLFVHGDSDPLPPEILHSAEFQRLARSERELLASALVAPVESLAPMLDEYIRLRATRMRLLPEVLRGVEPHEERKEGTAHYVGYVSTFMQADGDRQRVVSTLQADLRAPIDFAANGGGRRGPWRSWHIYATGGALGVLLDRMSCDWKPVVVAGYTPFGVLARATGSRSPLDDIVLPVPDSIRLRCAAARSVPIPDGVRRAMERGTRDPSGAPGPNYWQLHVDYDIDATLDPTTATIRASGTARFVNPSPDTLTVIPLWLDQNRFRPENAGNLPVASHTTGITITAARINGEPVRIADGAGGIRPSLVGSRSTAATIFLRSPLAPRDSAVIEFEWHFAVVEDEAGHALRQGRWGHDVFQVAQWYPRVAMLDDIAGWDTSAYDAELEFFNPFGRFDIRLTLPAGWLVGATGLLVNADSVLSQQTRQRLATVLHSDSAIVIASIAETRAGEATSTGMPSLVRSTNGRSMLMWHFVADSVSAFAWGASDRYAWTSVRAVIPGRAPIPVHWFHTTKWTPERESQLDEVRHSLEFNSGLLVPYAYPQHTLIDGPEGGMENPMLTMSDGTRHVHELWHQWFPMMVGTDESRYAFLDEGFANSLSGTTVAAHTGQPRASTFTSHPRMLFPLLTREDPQSPNIFLALYGYGRPAPMFRALADVVGHDRMIAALREYTAVWQFKHPTPWDFMFTMDHALERDLSAFWYKWLFTTEP